MELIKIKRLTNKIEDPFKEKGKPTQTTVVKDTQPTEVVDDSILDLDESTETLDQCNQANDSQPVEMVDSKPVSEEEKQVKKDPDENQVTILKRSIDMFNFLSNTIELTIKTEVDAWNVKFDCDKSIQGTSPFQKLIDLFDLYTGKFKKEHMEYLKEHDLLPKNEEETLDTKRVKGKDPITPIKQIKFFK